MCQYEVLLYLLATLSCVEKFSLKVCQTVKLTFVFFSVAYIHTYSVHSYYLHVACVLEHTISSKATHGCQQCCASLLYLS